MKLRLRSSESGETTKIDIFTPFTILQLRHAVAEKLSLPAASLRLSLNKSSELGDGLPPDTPFASLGVTAGDLIFYQVLDDFGVSSSAVVRNPTSGEAVVSPESVAVGDGVRPGDCSSSDSGGAHLKSKQVEASSACGEGKPLLEGTPVFSEFEAMDVDGRLVVDSLLDMKDAHGSSRSAMESIGCDGAGKPTAGGGSEMDQGSTCKDVSNSGICRSSVVMHAENYEFDRASSGAEGVPRSILGFLLRVFSEARNVKREFDFFIFAIHAIMLESGFLVFDEEKKQSLERFGLPDDWASRSTVSVSYTVRDLLVLNDIGNVVVLKVECFPSSVVVYGRLSGEMRRISLEFSRYVPSICAMVQQTYGPAYRGRCHHQKVVSQLWKLFKDNIALPLLHELCERTGLPPPSCLGCLPAELKSKVLERLPHLDLAKIGCVSKEYRYLSSNNDLWRKKYVEEFGSSEDGRSHWKLRFAETWRLRKHCISPNRLLYSIRMPHVSPNMGRPLWPSGVVGGDYDRIPFFSRHPFGSAPLPYDINRRGPVFRTGSRIGHNSVCDLGR